MKPNEQSRETATASALSADIEFWSAWWEEFNTQTIRAGDVSFFCTAFSHEARSLRVVFVGMALGILARRRISISLPDGTRVVAQHVPNEVNPLRKGGWRLWPVPSGNNGAGCRNPDGRQDIDERQRSVLCYHGVRKLTGPSGREITARTLRQNACEIY